MRIRRTSSGQREDQAVHAYALAAAGGAGDEHVRHFGDVPHNAVSGDVLAHGKAEPGRRIPEGRGIDDIPEVNSADDLVGDLNAYGGDLVGDRGDADVHHAQRQSQIPGQVGELVQLYPGLQLKIVAGDGGSSGDIADDRADPKAAQRGLQSFFVKRDLLPAVGGNAVPGFEKLDGGILVGGERTGVFDGLGDLVRRRLHFIGLDLFLFNGLDRDVLCRIDPGCAVVQLYSLAAGGFAQERENIPHFGDLGHHGSLRLLLSFFCRLGIRGLSLVYSSHRHLGNIIRRSSLSILRRLIFHGNVDGPSGSSADRIQDPASGIPGRSILFLHGDINVKGLPAPLG